MVDCIVLNVVGCGGVSERFCLGSSEPEMLEVEDGLRLIARRSCGSKTSMVRKSMVLYQSSSFELGTNSDLMA